MPTFIRQTARGLVRRPLFNALLLLLLTLGVSAFGTVFVLVTATVLRPLPFRDADRLYALSTLEPAGGNQVTQFALSPVQFLRFRESQGPFDRVEAYTPTTPKLTGDGEPASLRGAAVSGGLLDLIGATPLLGRSFRLDDDVPGSDVVILSHGFWQRRFGGDSAIVGSRVTIDDLPRTVIGVLQPSFSLFFREGDVFTTLGLSPEQVASPNLRFLAGIAHLRPGATEAQGVAQVQGVIASLAAEFPNSYAATQPKVVALRTALLGPQRSTVLLLLAAVGLLFLIACANAMNLSFADAIARRPATTTRLVLGASGGDVAAIRLAETLLIGMTAGLLAIGVSPAILALLRAANPAAFAGMGSVAFDTGTAAITLALALLAAALIGTPVAVTEARARVTDIAGSIGRSVGGRLDRRRRSLLLTLQVAVTLVLLCGTAILLRNVRSLLAMPTGFDATHVLVAPLPLSQRTYRTVPERANHVVRVLEAVRAIPGVEAASTTQTRFVLAESMNATFEVQEVPAEGERTRMTNIRHVTPGLLRTLGMRLVRGRAIDDTDRADGPPVAMVSESFARLYLPGEDPVGKHIRRASAKPGPWMEIVGVVSDVMDAGIGYDAASAFYVSYLQQNTATARVTLVVRSTGDPAAMVVAVRNAIWSVDPDQAIESVTLLESLVAVSTARPRFQALVTGFFAAVALTLALVGIYVVTLHDVYRHTREFGVRTALGARTPDLLRLALRGSLAPVVAGSLLGAAGVVPAVIWVDRVLGEGTNGVSVADAPALAVAALLLLGGTAAVALLAGLRVTRIDPAIAMRTA